MRRPRRPAPADRSQLVLPFVVAVHHQQIQDLDARVSSLEQVRAGHPPALGGFTEQNLRQVVDQAIKQSRQLPEPTVEFERGLGKSEDMLKGAEEALEHAHAASDLDDRLAAVVRLKEIISDAVEQARRRPRVYKHGLVILREALENTYAEDLTQEQLVAVADALNLLGTPDLDKQAVRTMAHRLRQTGLRSIPALTHEQRAKALHSLGLES